MGDVCKTSNYQETTALGELYSSPQEVPSSVSPEPDGPLPNLDPSAASAPHPIQSTLELSCATCATPSSLSDSTTRLSGKRRKSAAKFAEGFFFGPWRGGGNHGSACPLLGAPRHAHRVIIKIEKEKEKEASLLMNYSRKFLHWSHFVPEPFESCCITSIMPHTVPRVGLPRSAVLREVSKSG